MKYLEFTFRTSSVYRNSQRCTFRQCLGEAGFESFVEQADGGLTAYIQKELYMTKPLLKDGTCRLSSARYTNQQYSYVEAEDKDWNEEWEKNFFQPIVIGDRCVIHSTFHNECTHKRNMTSSSIRKWHSARDTTRQQASSSANCWTVTCKANHCSIWVVGLPFLPYWHACVEPPLVQLST